MKDVDRARHSVRAVVVSQTALVGKMRRARSDAPYLHLGESYDPLQMHTAGRAALSRRPKFCHARIARDKGLFCIRRFLVPCSSSFIRVYPCPSVVNCFLE